MLERQGLVLLETLLEWDHSASQGQVRVLDPARLEELRRTFHRSAPTMLLQATLVAPDHTSMPFRH